MRKIGAIAAGFFTWFVAFMALQMVGFWLWGMQPNNLPSELMVGFIASLIGLILAEELMKAIDKTLNKRTAVTILAILVAGSYALIFSIGGQPEAGYVPVVAGFGASFLPFIISILRTGS